MGNYSGQDAKMQIGLQTDFSTIASPTFQVDFTSESIKGIKNYITEDALLGLITTGRMDASGEKVEGNFSMIAKPDNIGLLIAAALGSEAAPAVVASTSTIYDHAFSCLIGGTAYSLPKLTIMVDRKADIFAFVGCKIDSMTINAAVGDYLRADFSIRGRHELAAQTLENLSFSTLRAFQFVDGDVTIDGSSVAGVTSFKLDVKNNLENDLYTLDSGQYMAEIEPQNREITVDMEMLYTESSNDDIRTGKYRAGAALALVATFTSTEAAGEGKYYSLTISIPLGYVTDAPALVNGPQRLKMPLSIKATQNASNQPITITLRDKDATAYLT